VGISAFNSLTLSPALSAAFLRHRPPSNFFLYRWFNSGFHGLSHGYAASVHGLVRLRWLVLVLFAVVIAATYWISTRIPSTFLPV
ncbi:efflux RND transporter permease subunit, partial [Acinetobacter baumannii]